MADEILWDQFGTPGTGAFSQNVSSIPNLTSLAADDFFIPGDEIWTINQVNARGYYIPEGDAPTTLNVNFFIPSLSIPSLPEADPFVSRLNIHFTDDGSGNFTIPLGDDVILSSGQYWVSVQVNLDTGFDLTTGSLTNGWFWASSLDSIIPTGPGAWKNPGNQFSSDATEWTVAQTPIPQLDTNDFNYQLIGVRQIIPPPCLFPETGVKTVNGIKPIKDIKADDIVIDFKGREVNVVYNIVFQNPKTDKFVQIPKDSLGENIPSEEVLIRKSHPILYKGREIEPLTLAKKLGKTHLIKEIKLNELVEVYSLCTHKRTFINMNDLMVATWEQNDWENRACNKVVRHWTKQ
jgi:hypothetical protein